jgi:hypothetical protein
MRLYLHKTESISRNPATHCQDAVLPKPSLRFKRSRDLAVGNPRCFSLARRACSVEYKQPCGHVPHDCLLQRSVYAQETSPSIDLSARIAETDDLAFGALVSLDPVRCASAESVLALTPLFTNLILRRAQRFLL